MRPFSAATVLAECGLTNTFGKIPEWALGWKRLLFEDVERGAAEPALLQRLHKRRLVDDVAARDVDEDRGRLEQGEPAGVDQVVGLGRVRRREDEDVGLGEQLVELPGRLDAVDAELGCRPPLERPHRADHACVERGREPSDLAADLAEADDADDLAAHFLVGVALPAVLALLAGRGGACSSRTSASRAGRTPRAAVHAARSRW